MDTHHDRHAGKVHDAGQHSTATWAFVLDDTGPSSCRLLVRSRSQRSPGFAGRPSSLGGELMDPITLLMTRKTLQGIRDRSEFAHV